MEIYMFTELPIMSRVGAQFRKRQLETQLRLFSVSTRKGCNSYDLCFLICTCDVGSAISVRRNRSGIIDLAAFPHSTNSHNIGSYPICICTFEESVQRLDKGREVKGASSGARVPAVR